MNLTVITPPAFEPVSLAEVYKHLRLDPEDSPQTHPHDDMLTRHIQTAREFVETSTRRALVAQTLRLSMGVFPYPVDCTRISDRFQRFMQSEKILLRRPPIVSVTSVKYFDGDNNLQTVDPASYYVTDEQVPELRFVSSFSAPTVYGRRDAVRIEYVAGYLGAGSPEDASQTEAAANVPSQLKDAILLTVQLLYDDLSPQDRDALERTREWLMQPLRIQHSL